MLSYLDLEVKMSVQSTGDIGVDSKNLYGPFISII